MIVILKTLIGNMFEAEIVCIQLLKNINGKTLIKAIQKYSHPIKIFSISLYIANQFEKVIVREKERI